MYKSKIHSNQFIIASIDKNNNWMRINYFVYPSYKDAQKDAEFFDSIFLNCTTTAIVRPSNS